MRKPKGLLPTIKNKRFFAIAQDEKEKEGILLLGISSASE